MTDTETIDRFKRYLKKLSQDTDYMPKEDSFPQLVIDMMEYIELSPEMDDPNFQALLPEEKYMSLKDKWKLQLKERAKRLLKNYEEKGVRDYLDTKPFLTALRLT
jgi:hypothetical protein